MPYEIDDMGLRVIGYNVPIEFYDDDRALQQTIYLQTDNSLNIGGEVVSHIPGSSGVDAHALSGPVHSGLLASKQAPQFLLCDGTRNLTGNLLVEGTTEIQFYDTALAIYSSADGQLDLKADTEIELTATTVDIQGDGSITGDLAFATTAKGITHVDGVTDGLVLRADGTRFVPDTLNIDDVGGVAPSDAQYVVLAVDDELSAERVLTAGDGLDLTDAGAGSTVTLAVDVTDILGSGLTESSNNIDLDWGTPTIGTIEPDDAANAGTSTNPARSDHQHAIVCAAPSGTLTEATANAEGSATSFARSDHTHDIDTSATRAPSDAQYVVLAVDDELSAERVLTAGDGIDLTDAGAGSTVTLAVDVTDILGSGLTESSNNIDLDWGTPTIGTIEPDDAANAGTSTNPARSDHQHAIVCAAPSGTLTEATANAEGSATSFARSDHTHDIDTSATRAPSDAQYVVLAVDDELSAERVLTAGDGLDLTDGGAGSTVTLAVDVTDILGSGLTESSNNIDLDWGTPTIGTIEPDDAANAGTSTNPARSDHQHAIVCAAPSANLSVSTTNAEGSATSFARSDHSHAITSSNAPGAAASLLATDASGYLTLVRLATSTGDWQLNSTTGLDFINGEAGTYITWYDTTFGGDVLAYERGSWAGGASDDVVFWNVARIPSGVSAGDANVIIAAVDVDAGTDCRISIDSGGIFDVDTSGACGITLDDDTNDFEVTCGADSYLNLNSTGQLSLGVDAGAISAANTTVGIVINQDANDDEIIALKSSDVGHGAYEAESDVFGTLRKAEGDAGGVRLTGYKDSGGVAGYALQLLGHLDENADTTKSTAGIAILMEAGFQTSSGSLADTVADGNVWGLRTRRGGSNVTIALIDEDGDLHLDAGGGTGGTVSAFAFDEYDDMALLTGLRASIAPTGHEMRERFAEFISYARPILETTGVVHYNDGPDEDGRPFVSMRGLQYLTIDAVRQLYERCLLYEQKLMRLEGMV